MKKPITLSLLLSMLIASLAACSSGDTTADTTAAADADTTAAVTEPAYDYGTHDYEGYEFRVLNLDYYCSAYNSLDFAEQTGESLNDAIYERNRYIENMYNFVMSEQQLPYVDWSGTRVELSDKVINSVMAGDSEYDAAYLIPTVKPAVITEGYLYDLYELPGLNLDEDYWDHTINDALIYEGGLYTASSPMHFMSIELSDVILFNEKILTDLGLEFLYDTALEGKWTLDKFLEYTEAAAMLNGADSFAFVDGGSAQYGIGFHTDKPISLAYGAGIDVVSYDDDGYTVHLEDERFVNVTEKIAQILIEKDGHILSGNSDTVPGGYAPTFKSGRAAFITCELKMAFQLRDMEDTFGLLPLPKYDEAQDDYRTHVSYNVNLLSVPLIQPDPERTGTILDAMSYYSSENLVDIYYDYTVSQKGLRNEESIKVLDIIYDTRGIDFSLIFGITTAFVNQYNVAARTGNGTVNLASLVASQKSAIEGNLETLFG